MKRNYKTQYNKVVITAISVMLLWLSFSLPSCKKYLDAKPDKSLEIPSNLQDCQALMDNATVMNMSHPFQGEVGSDNYYLKYSDWTSSEKTDRDDYIWKADADVNVGVWSAGYTAVLYANQVLSTLGGIAVTPANQPQWDALKGAALFYRGLAFYQLAQIWSPSYVASTASTDMGIPIRLSPDISVKSTRSTLKETYDQVLQDMQAAVTLLPDNKPVTNISKTRPCKAAAYAALSRVYLSMGDYTNAATNANNALQLYNTLMDYNQLDPASTVPITQFNPEVIFDASSGFCITLYYGKVDTSLYSSYQANDDRKKILFIDNGDGTFTFKGGYGGNPAYELFTGFATDELYLTRAECSARAGNTANALADLNRLLQNRFEPPFTPITAANADDALHLILTERRKELLFRGIRWTDLRRLNKDPQFAITQTRILNGTTYTLPPNDLRYVWLIPQAVLKQVNLPQNPR